MKTFVLVTKLAGRDAQLTEIGAKLQDRSRTGRAWLNEIKEKCPEIKFKAHYALMGYWDSMHIYEAPDEEKPAAILPESSSSSCSRRGSIVSWVSEWPCACFRSPWPSARPDSFTTGA